MGSMYFMAVASIDCLFLTMGLFMEAFHSHYKLLLDDIDELAETGQFDSDLQTQLKMRLVTAIDFHNQAKE